VAEVVSSCAAFEEFGSKLFEQTYPIKEQAQSSGNRSHIMTGTETSSRVEWLLNTFWTFAYLAKGRERSQPLATSLGVDYLIFLQRQENENMWCLKLSVWQYFRQAI
jgi:hypothetical protein